MEGKGVEVNYLTVLTHTDVCIHVSQRNIYEYTISGDDGEDTKQ